MNHMSTDSISWERWTPSLPVVYCLVCLSPWSVGGSHMNTGMEIVSYIARICLPRTRLTPAKNRDQVREVCVQSWNIDDDIVMSAVRGIEALAHCWSPRLIMSMRGLVLWMMLPLSATSNILCMNFVLWSCYILSDFQNILWASWYYQRPKSGGNHPWGVCACHNFRLVCDFNWECSEYKY